MSALFAVALLLAGCTDLFVAPAPPAPAAVAVAFGLAADASAASSEEMSAAYDQATHVRIGLSREGAQELDSVLPFEPAGTETTVSLAVEMSRAQEAAQLSIELLHDGAPLFRAGAQIELRAGETTPADLTLQPVPARVRVQKPLPVIESLGDTLRLTGEVLFATGHVIPEWTLTWQPLDAGVVEVSRDGVLVSRAEGEARVEGRHEEFADTVPVRVRAVVAAIEVQPGTSTLRVGETLQLAAVLRDARGNALNPRDPQGNLISSRAIGWSSSRATVAQVEGQSGLVSAVAPDTVTITATTSQGKSGSARLSIIPRPPVVAACTVSQVSGSAATLACEVNPNQAFTAVLFQWGTSPSLGNSTAPRQVGSGSTAQPVSETLQGLSPNTTYFWRVEASNAGGTTRTEILSFTTALITHTLTVNAGGTGDGTVTSNVGGINCTIRNGQRSGTCQASFNSGTQVTLTAVAAPRHSFSGWSGGGCSGTGTCTVTMNQNRAPTASFAPPSPLLYLEVSSSAWHNCARTVDDEVYCWGRNEFGQLGNNSTEHSSRPVAVETNLRFRAVAAGRFHTCALTRDDRAYCWGWNESGQLGNNSTRDSSVPVAVATDLRFRTLSVGEGHTCAVATDDRAYCWGWNQYGQLGSDTDGVDSWIPRQVDTRLGFRASGGGRYHTCAVGADEQAYCWGRNEWGQLGSDTEGVDVPIPIPVNTDLGFRILNGGRYHTCAVAADDRGYCWGRNNAGQLGRGEGGSSPTPVEVDPAQNLRFRSISTGDLHACAVGTDDRAYCWGRGNEGQLGNNTSTNSNRPVEVDPAQNLRFRSIGAGEIHTCGVTTDSHAYCWGRNSFGLLGNGTVGGPDRRVPGRVAEPQ